MKNLSKSFNAFSVDISIFSHASLSPLSSQSHNNMSISFYLLLFLLCISFQAWHLQSLHLADNKFQKKFLAPIKGRLAKIVVSWDKPTIESMKLSSSPTPEDQKEAVKSRRRKYKRRRKQVKKVEELKNVSWRVPDEVHKKVKGSNGVFGSDYEHARTHPPSHN